MKSEPCQRVELSRNEHHVTSVHQPLHHSEPGCHRSENSVTFSDLHIGLYQSTLQQHFLIYAPRCHSGKRIYGIQVSQGRHELNKDEQGYFLQDFSRPLLCYCEFPRKKNGIQFSPILILLQNAIFVNHITGVVFHRTHFSESFPGGIVKPIKSYMVSESDLLFQQLNFQLLDIQLTVFERFLLQVLDFFFMQGFYFLQQPMFLLYVFYQLFYK